MLRYSGWREAPNQIWSFSASRPEGSSVFLFGAEHSRDPAAPQFEAIAAAFAAARPTAVYFEGPDRGIAASAEEAIRTQGESGYVRFLAARAGLKAETLEPGPAELMTSLVGTFEPDRIMLFFVLREAARLRDREHLEGPALDSAVGSLLERALPLARHLGIETGITDLASLAAAASAHWPDRDWRSLPQGWFAPGEGPSEASFLPVINTAVSEARNLHMVRAFDAAARNGTRLFAVVGRNHVPMIAPALACALKR